jgi:hypothetical protein
MAACEMFEWCNAHDSSAPGFHSGSVRIESGVSWVDVTISVNQFDQPNHTEFDFDLSEWSVKLEDLDTEIHDLETITAGIVNVMTETRKSLLLAGVTR